MMELHKVQGGYITLEDIQRCVAMLDAEERLFTIEIVDQLKSLDPLLFSYFILYKQIKPDLEIVFNLPYATREETDETNRKIVFQLYQFLTNAYVISKMNVFTIKLCDGSIRIDEQLLVSHPKFPTNWFVNSSEFLPVILIDENNYEFYFETKLTELTNDRKFLPENMSSLCDGSDSGEAYRRMRYYLIESTNAREPKMAFLNLVQRYYVNILNKLDVAQIYFRLEEEEFSDKDNNNIYQIKFLLDQVLNSSIFHVIFFSLIIDIEIKKSEIKRGDTSDQKLKLLVNQAYSLWEFTKDMVSGIKELAKNIKDHAMPPLGAIAVRIFKETKWLSSKEEVENRKNYTVYDVYLKELHEGERIRKIDSVIDINIIDIGNQGIIPTLIKKTTELHDQLQNNGSFHIMEIKSGLKEDIDKLSKREITIENLLDPNTEQLNHQTKRSIAHFGLLILSNLISHNKGMMICSSDYTSVSYPKPSIDHEYPIRKGVSYNIILPIRTTEYKTHLPGKPFIPLEISAKDIQGIELLFDYKWTNIHEISSISDTGNSGNKHIIHYCLESVINIQFKDDENLLKNQILNNIQAIINHGIKHFALCLDLNNVSINESQFLRLLGKIELFYPSIPLMILNISNQLYESLISLNGMHYKIIGSQKMPYWNDNVATLVYSYIVIKGRKFYFTDALWGKDRDHFIRLNWLISRLSLNSNTLIHKDGDSYKESLKKEISVNPSPSFFFYNDNQLLPFDLIIEGEKDMTLFESNINLLLGNDLII